MKKKSRVDLQLLELLNSFDCPGGSEWIFFQLASQQEQEAHPSPNKIRFLFSRIQGWVGRDPGGQIRGLACWPSGDGHFLLQHCFTWTGRREADREAGWEGIATPD